MPVGQLVLFIGGVFLALFITMMLIKPENRYICVYDFIFIFSIISLLLSTLFAKDPIIALGGVAFNNEGVVILLVYLLMAYAASFVISYKCRRCILISLLVFGIFELFVGTMQSIIESTWFLGFPASTYKEIENEAFIRAFGTLYNSNPFGQLTGMLAGLEFGLFFTADCKKNKLIHGFLSAAFVFGILISDTMGAIIGLLAAAFICSVYLIVYHRKDKGQMFITIKKIAIILLLCVLTFMLLCVISPTWLEFVLGRAGVSGGVIGEAIGDGNTETIDAIGSGRVWAWRKGWEEYFLNYPIIGVGVSNIMLVEIEVNPIEFFVFYVIHNHYLDVLYSQGIIGLSAHLLLMGYVLVGAFRLLKRDGMGKDRFRLGIVIAIISFLLIDITQWHSIYLTPYFYVLLGLAFPRSESKRIFGKKTINCDGNE